MEKFGEIWFMEEYKLTKSGDKRFMEEY